MKPARNVIADVLDQGQSGSGPDEFELGWADEILDALVGEGYVVTLIDNYRPQRIEFGPNLRAALGGES